MIRKNEYITYHIRFITDINQDELILQQQRRIEMEVNICYRSL